MVIRKILSIFFVIICLTYIGNNWIRITNYIINLNNLSSEFNGFKIVHLSDVHNKMFGKQQKYLAGIIEKQNPDIIVITGDLIDRRRYNKENALKLLNRIVEIAPVYYVTGNHEWWSGKYKSLKKDMQETGVIVLSDTKVEIVRDDNVLNILGVDDPAKYYEDYLGSKTGYEATSETLDSLIRNVEKEVTILLSHRPELFDVYQSKDLNLVLSGHAHGGQVRLPMLGGLFSPNQGMFPEYDSGLYQEGETNMIVSRGLGNSIMPIRLFNRPEVVSITLNNKVN